MELIDHPAGDTSQCHPVHVIDGAGAKQQAADPPLPQGSTLLRFLCRSDQSHPLPPQLCICSIKRITPLEKLAKRCSPFSTVANCGDPMWPVGVRSFVIHP